MGRGTCPCGGLCGRPRCCAFSGKTVPEMSSAKRAKLELCADFNEESITGCNSCVNCKAAWCSACSGRERKHCFSAGEVAVGAERAVRLAPAPRAKAAPKPKAPLPPLKIPAPSKYVHLMRSLLASCFFFFSTASSRALRQPRGFSPAGPCSSRTILPSSSSRLRSRRRTRQASAISSSGACLRRLHLARTQRLQPHRRRRLVRTVTPGLPLRALRRPLRRCCRRHSPPAMRFLRHWQRMR